MNASAEKNIILIMAALSAAIAAQAGILNALTYIMPPDQAQVKEQMARSADNLKDLSNRLKALVERYT